MEGIYIPKDIHHNPYFIIKDNDIFLNKECILSESDYERMCDIKGVNPIYPNGVATKVDSGVFTEKEIYSIRKNNPKGCIYHGNRKFPDCYHCDN